MRCTYPIVTPKNLFRRSPDETDANVRVNPRRPSGEYFFLATIYLRQICISPGTGLDYIRGNLFVACEGSVTPRPCAVKDPVPSYEPGSTEGIMNYSHRIFVPISILLLFAFVSGCGGTQPPDEELKLVQQAIEQAKTVQAEKLAAADWSNAEAKMNDAQFAIKNKRYSDAKTFYLQAKSRYEKAFTVGKAKHEMYMREVDEERTALGTNLGKLKAMAAKAPTKMKKETEASIAEIDQKIAELDKAVQDKDAVKAKLTSKEVNGKIFDVIRVLETGGKR
jgi:hypothetical protein